MVDTYMYFLTVLFYGISYLHDFKVNYTDIFKHELLSKNRKNKGNWSNTVIQ